MNRRWKMTAALIALLGLTLAGAAPGLAADPQPVVAAPAPEPADLLPYADIKPGHWAYPAVKLLHANELVAGEPGARFRPEEPVMRAELVKLILGSRRLDPSNECQAMFRDVPCSAWYAPWAEISYRVGIVDGIGIDLFGPELPVTREQLFTLVIRGLGLRYEADRLSWRWAEVEQVLSHFDDKRQIADWARGPVALALRHKLAAGYADGTFRPKALASRAEAAALISRIVVPIDELHPLAIDGRTVRFHKAYDMIATMYSTGEPDVGTITYTGMKVRLGAIAVDPRVIPLGTLLYVEGYGYGVAADIGGAIKGQRVDLFTHEHTLAARLFGMQPRKVWVLP